MCHFNGIVREKGHSEPTGLVHYSSLSAITPDNFKHDFGQLESIY
jgi:hypothetical protein